MYGVRVCGASVCANVRAVRGCECACDQAFVSSFAGQPLSPAAIATHYLGKQGWAGFGNGQGNTRAQEASNMGQVPVGCVQVMVDARV